MSVSTRRWCLGGVAYPLLLLAETTVLAQEYTPPSSVFDPRLTELRLAALTWDAKRPTRQVVDQVCLVPDEATFLQAIAAWDERSYFPILIEDGEYTLKFLRAFRPAKVLRYPARARPIPADKLWDEAEAAVGRSWTGNDQEAPVGSRPPRSPKVGSTPPGIVVSSAESPSLTGAVALAAGRFQPLRRWTTSKHYADALSQDEAEALALELEGLVAQVLPQYGKLGDDCDFLTLAGDYPWKYQSDSQPFPGPAAFDDLIGRAPKPAEPNQARMRWAYTGRLIGNPTESVYRAMASLFLSPTSAVLFNSYDNNDPAFSGYTLQPAQAPLARLLRVRLSSGPTSTDLRGWHRAFDPINRAGLLFINTSGGSTQFNLPGGSGQTGDVPATFPTVIHMIHSFSAENPLDSRTLAGRWLSHGAYLYCGSMYEPYLQSFRHPPLIARLLSEGYPLAAAVRMTPFEILQFGNPWRLVILGDPLFRLNKPPQRLDSTALAATTDWPAYRPEPAPAAYAEAFSRLAWAAKAAILSTQADGSPRALTDVAKVLLGISREQLPAPYRHLHDALLCDALFQIDRLPELRSRLGRIPEAELSEAVQRCLETARMVGLYRGIESDNWVEILAAWDELIRSRSSRELKELVTQRVGKLATDSAKARFWADRLRAVKSTLDRETIAVIESEQRRLSESPLLKNAAPAKSTRRR